MAIPVSHTIPLPRRKSTLGRTPAMQTNIAGVYAAGHVAAAIDFSTGVRGMNAIQPNAVEQAGA